MAINCYNNKKFVGCDMHKRYSVFVAAEPNDNSSYTQRVPHTRELVRIFLQTLPSQSQIAVESVGNWYWLVDEIESAGHLPLLAHAHRAKLMMVRPNKTDKLDATGLSKLLLNGTLPTVWIPPRQIRDLRELCRWRMFLSSIRTKLKNRIHSTLSKYLVTIDEVSDIFGKKGKEILLSKLNELPPHTRQCVEEELTLLGNIQNQLGEIESRIDDLAEESEEIKLLMSIPGVGKILATVISLEIGSVERFAGPTYLASYSGLVPTVKSSGGRMRNGRTSRECNHYLKWAFTEAANVIVRYRKTMSSRYVVKLYERVRGRRGHSIAVVAVARHLAEAGWNILKKKEGYKEINCKDVSFQQG